MTATRTELRALEGQQVSLTLTDGTHMDACSLVSAGRASVGTVWVFAEGDDTFIPLSEVINVRAAASLSGPVLAATLPTPVRGPIDHLPAGCLRSRPASANTHRGKERRSSDVDVLRV
jgi:hypothetical protein